MRLIDAEAVIHVELFNEEREEYFVKEMTVAEMIAHYTEEAEVPEVDAIPVDWLIEQEDSVRNSDAFRDECAGVRLAWMAERKEE